MKTKLAIIALSGIFIFGVSCKKQSAYEKLDGTWEATESILLGTTVPGNGSTLSFTDCGTPPCEGSDYYGVDKTSGTFTYELLNEDKTLSIVDTSSLGSNWSADWEVDLLTKSSLTITANTGWFGDMTVKFTKK